MLWWLLGDTELSSNAQGYAPSTCPSDGVGSLSALKRLRNAIEVTFKLLKHVYTGSLIHKHDEADHCLFFLLKKGKFKKTMGVRRGEARV